MDDLDFGDGQERPPAYGYCRVSSDAQADRKNSPAYQFHNLIRGADQRGLDLGEVRMVDGLESRDRIVLDVASATKYDFRDRPGGKWLWDNLEEGDHLLFVHVDRGFRSLYDTMQTLKHFRVRKVKVHFMDIGLDSSTPFGEAVLDMVVAMLASVARIEAVRLGARVREAHAAIRRMGRLAMPSEAGIGYRLIKKKVGKKYHYTRTPDHWNTCCLKFIKWLRKTVGLSGRATAVWLHKRGIKRSDGDAWTQRMVEFSTRTKKELPDVDTTEQEAELARIVRQVDPGFEMWNSKTVSKKGLSGAVFNMNRSKDRKFSNRRKKK